MHKNQKKELSKELSSLRQVLIEIVFEQGLSWRKIAIGTGLPYATISSIKHGYSADVSMGTGVKIVSWIAQHYPGKKRRIKELLELPF